MKDVLEPGTSVQVFFAGSIRLTFPDGAAASDVERAMAAAYSALSLRLDHTFYDRFPTITYEVTDSYEGNDAADYLDPILLSDSHVKIGDS